MTWWIVGVGMALLAGGLAVAGFFGSPAGAPNATATFTLVAATAVGIERTLEGFWVVAGQLANSWWPLSIPAQRLDQFVSSLNQQVKPLVDRAKTIISAAEADTSRASDSLKNARGQLDALQKYLDQISIASPPTQSQAAAMIAAINGLAVWDSRLGQGADVAKTAIADLSTFADGFTDNAARKLISLYAGALIGSAIAAFAHLDLFRASGIVDDQVGRFFWGVALTGVVMGLGSNPAHEVIKAIQEFKNNQRQSASDLATAVSSTTGGQN
jgi:hypothetical protein